MKGIWIPLELLELDISWTKRILIAEISQLEMLDKGCIASNSHFAEKLKLSNQAVSKALNELAEDGYILIDNAQSKRNFGRKITINFSKSAINFSKSAINFSKSAINFSGESKEKNTINKTINMLIKKYCEEKQEVSEKEISTLENFIKYRNEIGDSVKTIAPLKIFIKNLILLRNLKYNIDDCIEIMKENEWKTIKVEWIHKPSSKKYAYKDEGMR